MRYSHALLVTALLVVTPWTVRGDVVDYQRDIKPLLTQKCGTCHGALRQESGLRLDAAQLIRKGSRDGAVLAPGRASQSRLFQRVSADDPVDRMPPEGEGEPFNKEQLALLKAWIEAGAPSPDEENVPAGPHDHWAYQPLVRPPVPTADLAKNAGHPIDLFLDAAQREAGVEPLPPADRATLLRRVTFDLIGLPPSPEQLQAFLRDESNGAYERLVDRLLYSPQHGERWARHWMDVWRYSDWDGFKDQLRGSQRHIWRWRDWIVESLNADKGYDQMIREMLAGDELAPADNDVLRATGFLARNFHKSNRNIWLDATVEHTAKAFLGLTLNCARCHDHKYDPVSQHDYYAFRAIFEPHDVRIERLPGEADLDKQGLARAYDGNPEAKTYLYIAGNEKHPDEEHPLAPQIPELFGELADITEVHLPLASWFPGGQEFIHREDISTAENRLHKAQQDLTALLAKLPTETARQIDNDTTRPPAPALPTTCSLEEQLARARVDAAQTQLMSLQARWAADEARYLKNCQEAANALSKHAGKLEKTAALQQAQLALLTKEQLLQKAQSEPDETKRKTSVDKALKERTAAQQAETKARDALADDGDKYTSVGNVYPRTSTGRRSALARWITDPGNPLTARVAVNHIWLRHFGEPLVGNVFDFGLRSPRPRHAELLDWLAVELMEHGWSMRHIHRLIVTSAAYRRASSGETALVDANRAIDPDNALLWRANVRRLDAEAVRDSVLAVAGSLDNALGGPDIDFHDGETVTRRSLYFRHAYEKQMTMLVLFDAANPTDCYRRSESIVPQQALTLANSQLALTSSRKLARRLSERVQSMDDAEEQFIQHAFECVLARSPTAEEADACREFLATQAALLADPAQLADFGGKVQATIAAADDPVLRARENLVHVLMNHNDFVTVR